MRESRDEVRARRARSAMASEIASTVRRMQRSGEYERLLALTHDEVEELEQWARRALACAYELSDHDVEIVASLHVEDDTYDAARAQLDAERAVRRARDDDDGTCGVLARL